MTDSPGKITGADIEAVIRAGIRIGREQMQARVVEYISDWMESLDSSCDGYSERHSVLTDVVCEIELWENT